VTDPSRTATAVAVLAEDPDARRLVVAWPLVEAGLTDTALLVAWSRVSAVPLSRVRRLGEVLVRHGICRPDRTVDPEATRVVQHLAAEVLRTKNRSRR